MILLACRGAVQFFIVSCTRRKLMTLLWWSFYFMTVWMYLIYFCLLSKRSQISLCFPVSAKYGLFPFVASLCQHPKLLVVMDWFMETASATGSLISDQAQILLSVPVRIIFRLPSFVPFRKHIQTWISVLRSIDDGKLPRRNQINSRADALPFSPKLKHLDKPYFLRSLPILLRMSVFDKRVSTKCQWLRNSPNNELLGFCCRIKFLWCKFR